MIATNLIFIGVVMFCFGELLKNYIKNRKS